MTGAELITKERLEQIGKHGRTVERDMKENPNSELIDGAVALLLDDPDYIPVHWDADLCRKMQEKSDMNKLIISGALIAAEIDRRLAKGDNS